MQLKRYIPPAPAPREIVRALTLEPGTVNRHGQKVVGKAGRAADDLPGQSTYVLRCTRCCHEYGVPGIRVHGRKCPECDGGKAGSAVPESEPTLFGG